MAQRLPCARRASPGFTMTESLVGILLVFALLFGVLVYMTRDGGGAGEDYGVSPYRAFYADYIRNNLNGWKSAILSFKGTNGALPGDCATPRAANSSGQFIGDNNGRVEREKEENLKFFQDLYAAGLASDPRILVRGRTMDFYWADLTKNGATAVPDNYMKLPGIHHDEALALDRKTDDGDRRSGDVVFFDNPDGSVDLFVRFNPY